MKNDLLTASDFNRLSSQRLGEIYNFLRTTIYSRDVSVVPEERFDARILEEASTNNFIRTFNKILKSSPKDIEPLLTAMLNKFEAENIKALLRAKMAGLEIDEAVRYLTLLGKADAISYRDVLLKAKTIEELVELLSVTEYGPLLNLALQDYKKEGTLLPFDSALDRYIYTNLWIKTTSLSGEDVKIAKEVLGTEMDMQNIKIILRCKTLRIDKEAITRYIIPINYKTSLKTLENGINAQNVNEALQAFLGVKSYKEDIESALRAYEASNSLSPVEMILDKLTLRTNLEILRRHPFPFDLGVVLSFLSLKWVEVRNLRIIVKGREDNLPPERIEKLLILP